MLLGDCMAGLCMNITKSVEEELTVVEMFQFRTIAVIPGIDLSPLLSVVGPVNTVVTLLPGIICLDLMLTLSVVQISMLVLA